MVEKKLTGKIPREHIRLMETPRAPDGVIEGFQELVGGSLRDIRTMQ